MIISLKTPTVAAHRHETPFLNIPETYGKIGKIGKISKNSTKNSKKYAILDPLILQPLGAVPGVDFK